MCTEEVSVSAKFQRLIYNFFFFKVFGVPVCKTRNSCIDGYPYNLPDLI
jgi:hypothetical protein